MLALLLSGIAPQGTAARHLLPGVALARPPVPSRTEARRGLRLPLQRQAEGRLHQPVPLPARGESRWVD